MYSYNVTLAIDNGELPSGNGRKKSKEVAKMSLEDTIGTCVRNKIFDTSVISAPSFEYGDTTWVVSIECEISEDDVTTLEENPHVEDIEEIIIVE